MFRSTVQQHEPPSCPSCGKRMLLARMLDSDDGASVFECRWWAISYTVAAHSSGAKVPG